MNSLHHEQIARDNYDITHNSNVKENYENQRIKGFHRNEPK